MDKKEKNTVCFSIENEYLKKLKNISETKGPSSARIIEKAVEEYLKNINTDNNTEVNDKKFQMCFYPPSEIYQKLKHVAKDEGRSVSSLVSLIVKTYIRNTEES
jgi:predicted DNA-binding protein